MILELWMSCVDGWKMSGRKEAESQCFGGRTNLYGGRAGVTPGQLPATINQKRQAKRGGSCLKRYSRITARGPQQ